MHTKQVTIETKAVGVNESDLGSDNEGEQLNVELDPDKVIFVSLVKMLSLSERLITEPVLLKRIYLKLQTPLESCLMFLCRTFLSVWRLRRQR